MQNWHTAVQDKTLSVETFRLLVVAAKFVHQSSVKSVPAADVDR